MKGLNRWHIAVLRLAVALAVAALAVAQGQDVLTALQDAVLHLGGGQPSADPLPGAVAVHVPSVSR